MMLGAKASPADQASLFSAGLGRRHCARVVQKVGNRALQFFFPSPLPARQLPHSRKKAPRAETHWPGFFTSTHFTRPSQHRHSTFLPHFHGRLRVSSWPGARPGALPLPRRCLSFGLQGILLMKPGSILGLCLNEARSLMAILATDTETKSKPDTGRASRRHPRHPDFPALGPHTFRSD